MKPIQIIFLTLWLVGCSKQYPANVVKPLNSPNFITVVILDPIPPDVTSIEFIDTQTEMVETLEITPADVGIKNKNVRLRAHPSNGYVYAEITLNYSSKLSTSVPFSVRLTGNETKILLEGLFSTGIKVSIDPAWAGESIVKF